MNCPKLWYIDVNILYLLFILELHIYTDFIFLVVIIHGVVPLKLYPFYQRGYYASVGLFWWLGEVSHWFWNWLTTNTEFTSSGYIFPCLFPDTKSLCWTVCMRRKGISHMFSVCWKLTSHWFLFRNQHIQHNLKQSSRSSRRKIWYVPKLYLAK